VSSAASSVFPSSRCRPSLEHFRSWGWSPPTTEAPPSCVAGWPCCLCQCERASGCPLLLTGTASNTRPLDGRWRSFLSTISTTYRSVPLFLSHGFLHRTVPQVADDSSAAPRAEHRLAESPQSPKIEDPPHRSRLGDPLVNLATLQSPSCSRLWARRFHLRFREGDFPPRSPTCLFLHTPTADLGCGASGLLLVLAPHRPQHSTSKHTINHRGWCTTLFLPSRS